MSHPITAVLFDFDDTLVDSFPVRLATLEKIFADARIAEPTGRSFFQDLGGAPFAPALAALQARLGVELDLFQSFTNHYWQKEPGQVRLFDGVSEMLAELLTADLKLGVVTSKGRDWTTVGRVGGAIFEMRELGIEATFPTVIGLEDVVHGKPHPEGLLLALERLGVPAAEAIYVGDAPADIAAAKAAGVTSCWASWGSLYADAIEPTPDHIAAKPGDLLDVLRKRRG